MKFRIDTTGRMRLRIGSVLCVVGLFSAVGGPRCSRNRGLECTHQYEPLIAARLRYQKLENELFICCSIHVFKYISKLPGSFERNEDTSGLILSSDPGAVCGHKRTKIHSTLTLFRLSQLYCSCNIYVYI
jgi:hypothetical protein